MTEEAFKQLIKAARIEVAKHAGTSDHAYLCIILKDCSPEGYISEQAFELERLMRETFDLSSAPNSSTYRVEDKLQTHREALGVSYKDANFVRLIMLDILEIYVLENNLHEGL